MTAWFYKQFLHMARGMVTIWAATAAILVLSLTILWLIQLYLWGAIALFEAVYWLWRPQW